MKHRQSFRLIMGIFGVVLLICAIIWSWLAGSTRPEAVVLATLGIGTLLLYLAYSGQLLSGLTAGGVEATFADVVDVINDPGVPGEVKARVEKIVREGSAPLAVQLKVNEFSTAHLLALDFEAQVKAELDRLGSGGRWVLETLGSGGSFDFKIANRTNQTVRVECRWAAKTPDADLFAKWKKMAQDQGGTTLGDGILLVVSDLPPKMAEPGVVSWKSQTREEDLKTEIANAFRPALPAQPVQPAAQPAVQQGQPAGKP